MPQLDSVGAPGRLLAMPLVVLNMGAEMVYILEQRLHAQSIAPDKSRKGAGAAGGGGAWITRAGRAHSANGRRENYVLVQVRVGAVQAAGGVLVALHAAGARAGRCAR